MSASAHPSLGSGQSQIPPKRPFRLRSKQCENSEVRNFVAGRLGDLEKIGIPSRRTGSSGRTATGFSRGCLSDILSASSVDDLSPRSGWKHRQQPLACHDVEKPHQNLAKRRICAHKGSFSSGPRGRRDVMLWFTGLSCGTIKLTFTASASIERAHCAEERSHGPSGSRT